MGSNFSFRLFYLQYPPPICGFGMRSGISHVCKVFIRKFLPEISVNIPSPSPSPFPSPSPSHRFSGRNILKKLFYHGGALYIYIHISQFKCKSFELVCRAARTRQEADASWFSPTWCFSTVNIPKLFADSA